MKTLLYISAAIALAIPSYAGITMTSTVATEASGSQPAQRMETKSSIEGTSARIDFVKSTSTGMKAGTFLLTRDSGATMWVVNPEEKTYLDMAQMMAMGSAMGGMMKFSNPNIEKLLDEPGPKLLGYPTRHYKFRTSYTIDMMIMKTPIVQNEEVWVAESFNDAALKAWSKAMMPNMGGDFQKLVDAMVGRYKGLPLKSVLTQTSQAGGKAQTSTTTTLITGIKEGTIPAATFELPSGFEKQEMSMPEMPAGMPFGKGE
jgi:hypothetical protein